MWVTTADPLWRRDDNSYRPNGKPKSQMASGHSLIRTMTTFGFWVSALRQLRYPKTSARAGRWSWLALSRRSRAGDVPAASCVGSPIYPPVTIPPRRQAILGHLACGWQPCSRDESRCRIEHSDGRGRDYGASGTTPGRDREWPARKRVEEVAVCQSTFLPRPWHDADSHR
jgi:hypothetical protein